MNGIEYIKTEKAYTTEELFHMIENCSFTAGRPVYKTSGPMKKKIKLPAVGRYCIQILAGGNRIQLTVVDDMEQQGSFWINRILGWFLGIFAGIFNKDKTPSYELLTKTTAELKSYLGIK